MKSTPNTAADMAANFQVNELEPRLENAWSGGRDTTAIEHPCPAAGCP